MTGRAFSLLVVASCLAGVLAGCWREQPAVAKQRHLDRAKAYLAANQLNEAIIEARNALRIDHELTAAVHLLGRAYGAKRYYFDALRELRRAADLDPEDLEIRLDLGGAYLKLEDWNDAMEEAAVVLERRPADPVAHYIRGAALSGKGDNRDALIAIDTALAAEQRPEFHVVRGDVLTGLDKLADAEQSYRAALAQNPKFVLATAGLAELLRRRNQHDEAERLLHQAKADDPGDATVRVLLGRVHAARGKFDEAIKEIEGLPREAWTPRATWAAGQLYVQIGRFEDAVSALKPLKEIVQDHPAALYWLGHGFLGSGRPELAINEFQAAVEKAPNNALIRFGLAQGFLAATRPLDALAELQKIAKPLEKWSLYHIVLARTYLALGNPDEAVNAAQRAAALSPQNAAAHTLVGKAQASRGDMAAAHQAFTRAVAAEPTYVPGRLALGHAYNVEGRVQDALREYERAIADSPRNEGAAEGKVTSLLQQGHLDEALTFARSVVQSAPKSAASHALLGRVHASRNEMQSAERALKDALRLNEDFVPALVTLGQVLIAGGKTADATVHLQRALKVQPGNEAATMMLADVHAREFRYDQAIAVLESAERTAADRTPLALTIANISLRAGLYDNVITRLAPLAKHSPNLVQPRLLTGLAFMGKTDLPAAIAQFEAVNRIDPKLADGHYYLARALVARGDVPAATKAYERAVALAPDRKQLRLELAAASGKPLDPVLLASWIDQLKGALAKDPTNTALRQDLAYTYLAKNQIAEAGGEFSRILETTPLLPAANRGMAVVYLGQNKREEAVPFLRSLLRVEPYNSWANINLASYYESKGNLEQAVHHVEEALRPTPDDLDLKLRLAQLYGTTGRSVQGIARAREVVAAAPKLALGHYVLGMLLLQDGNVGPAIESLTTSTRLNPDAGDAQYALALAYERKGDTTAALPAYRRAMAANPNDARAFNNAAYIQARERRGLDEALKWAERARELAPNSGPILDTLGYVHYQRGEYDKAAPVLKRATELVADNATMMYHLGATYYKLGRREEAAVALRRALQLDERIPQATEIRTMLARMRR